MLYQEAACYSHDTAAQHHTTAAYTAQHGSFSQNCLSQQQQYQPADQCMADGTSGMTCQETCRWDDQLLEDSPGSGSFESASTTYNPHSDESIPESYTSSTASMPWTAFTAASTSSLQQVPAEHIRPGQHSRLPAASKPPLAPVSQQVQASEHRRYT